MENPTLDRLQIGTLRRCVRQAQQIVHAVYGADPEAVRRGGLDLIEDIGRLHRSVEPNAYGREAGGRP